MWKTYLCTSIKNIYRVGEARNLHLVPSSPAEVVPNSTRKKSGLDLGGQHELLLLHTTSLAETIIDR